MGLYRIISDFSGDIRYDRLLVCLRIEKGLSVSIKLGAEGEL